MLRCWVRVLIFVFSLVVPMLVLASVESDGGWRALEFVYLFDRKLEYTSGMGDYDIGSTLMIRAVTRDARQIESGGMPH